MSGYSKLSSSLTASSLWSESDAICKVFITMLSLADSDGIVKASIVGLACLSRKTLPETEAALAVLLAPDPHSGRKELDGRRIVPVVGGWHIVTHEFYREMGMSEDSKRYWMEKKREQRSRNNVQNVQKCPRQSETLGYGNGTDAESIYAAYPKKVGRPTAIKAIEKALSKFSAPILLEKTKSFAAARAGNLEFVPHPATWFNQERFNDDPSTWKPSINGAAGVRAKKRSGEYPEPLHDDSLVWRPAGVKKI